MACLLKKILLTILCRREDPVKCQGIHGASLNLHVVAPTCTLAPSLILHLSCGRKRTRTSTILLSLAPEASVSTNSTIRPIPKIFLNTIEISDGVNMRVYQFHHFGIFQTKHQELFAPIPTQVGTCIFTRRSFSEGGPTCPAPEP